MSDSIVVKVKCKQLDQEIIAPFHRCLLDITRGHRCPRNEPVKLSFSFDGSVAILFESVEGAPFQHSERCPGRSMEDPEYQRLHQEHFDNCVENPVKFAVGLIVASRDRHVLMSKRGLHMRTFPGLWVPPGGGVDPGETLKDAAARELWEEVGLRLTPEEVENMSLLGGWESVYPTHAHEGFPIRHHVVLYFLANLALDHIDPRLQGLAIDPGEVAEARWVSREVLQRFLAKEHRGNFDQELSGDPSKPGMGMALGTEFILRQWLQNVGY